MFYKDKSTEKRSDFVQEYAYVEDYSLYHQSTYNKEEDEYLKTVVIIDLNEDSTFEI